MTQYKLRLEVNKFFMESRSVSNLKQKRILITPPISEIYWIARVRVTRRQALLLFPKFSTYGIGFAYEKDWNTNLPYSESAEKIFNHIKCNKGKVAKDKDCLKAIKLLKKFALGVL